MIAEETIQPTIRNLRKEYEESIQRKREQLQEETQKRQIEVDQIARKGWVRSRKEQLNQPNSSNSTREFDISRRVRECTHVPSSSTKEFNHSLPSPNQLSPLIYGRRREYETLKKNDLNQDELQIATKFEEILGKYIRNNNEIRNVQKRERQNDQMKSFELIKMREEEIHQLKIKISRLEDDSRKMKEHQEVKMLERQKIMDDSAKRQDEIVKSLQNNLRDEKNSMKMLKAENVELMMKWEELNKKYQEKGQQCIEMENKIRDFDENKMKMKEDSKFINELQQIHALEICQLKENQKNMEEEYRRKFIQIHKEAEEATESIKNNMNTVSNNWKEEEQIAQMLKSENAALMMKIEELLAERELDRDRSIQLEKALAESEQKQTMAIDEKIAILYELKDLKICYDASTDRVHQLEEDIKLAGIRAEEEHGKKFIQLEERLREKEHLLGVLQCILEESNNQEAIAVLNSVREK